MCWVLPGRTPARAVPWAETRPLNTRGSSSHRLGRPDGCGGLFNKHVAAQCAKSRWDGPSFRQHASPGDSAPTARAPRPGGTEPAAGLGAGRWDGTQGAPGCAAAQERGRALRSSWAAPGAVTGRRPAQPRTPIPPARSAHPTTLLCAVLTASDGRGGVAAAGPAHPCRQAIGRGWRDARHGAQRRAATRQIRLGRRDFRPAAPGASSATAAAENGASRRPPCPRLRCCCSRFSLSPSAPPTWWSSAMPTSRAVWLSARGWCSWSSSRPGEGPPGAGRSGGAGPFGAPGGRGDRGLGRSGGRDRGGPWRSWPP